MANLYALQRDLDMVTRDVESLKRSYNLLDYIAKVVHDSELEQMAQAAQMRRMEGRLDNLEKRVALVESRLEKVEVRLDKVEARLDKIEKSLDLLVKNLAIVTKHLGIKTE